MVDFGDGKPEIDGPLGPGFLHKDEGLKGGGDVIP